MDDSQKKLLYRVETAASKCEMGRSKFWELVMSGEIPSIKIGRSRRIPAAALDAWIENQIAVPSGSEIEVETADGDE